MNFRFVLIACVAIGFGQDSLVLDGVPVWN
jgi:hypothetical protein